MPIFAASQDTKDSDGNEYSSSSSSSDDDEDEDEENGEEEVIKTPHSGGGGKGFISGKEILPRINKRASDVLDLTMDPPPPPPCPQEEFQLSSKGLANAKDSAPAKKAVSSKNTATRKEKAQGYKKDASRQKGTVSKVVQQQPAQPSKNDASGQNLAQKGTVSKVVQQQPAQPSNNNASGQNLAQKGAVSKVVQQQPAQASKNDASGQKGTVSKVVQQQATQPSKNDASQKDTFKDKSAVLASSSSPMDAPSVETTNGRYSQLAKTVMAKALSQHGKSDKSLRDIDTTTASNSSKRKLVDSEAKTPVVMGGYKENQEDEQMVVENSSDEESDTSSNARPVKLPKVQGVNAFGPNGQVCRKQRNASDAAAHGQNIPDAAALPLFSSTDGNFPPAACPQDLHAQGKDAPESCPQDLHTQVKDAPESCPQDLHTQVKDVPEPCPQDLHTQVKDAPECTDACAPDAAVVADPIHESSPQMHIQDGDAPVTASGEVKYASRAATGAVVLQSCKPVSMRGFFEDACKYVNSDDLMGFDL
jgi:hypothetical protein